jgi:GNAT superfamily N-acetyltransferase
MTGGDEHGAYERVYEALYSHLSLGNRVIDTDFARYVTNPAALSVYDANHVQSVRADSEAAIDSVLALADQLFEDCRHRRIFIDPWTPLEVEAYLTLRDYEPRSELVLLLGADLRIDVQDVLDLDLRLVESDDDWNSFEQLLRLDHEEEEERGIGTRSPDLTHQVALTKRSKAPDVRFWLARIDDADCAFCSSWSGSSGVGIVEDLFTRQDFRHRGVATALIGHCVADSRARGAGPVVISALVDDTPKSMYAALGFRPVCINRSYLKQAGP